MTPSRVWYRRRDVPHSETGLSLWRPPEPGMHCVRCELSLSIFRRQLKTYLFYVFFQEKSTKPIAVILIWLFMHFYRILYCFYIFVQCSCGNCDSDTLKIHFCNNNNKNNNHVCRSADIWNHRRPSSISERAANLFLGRNTRPADYCVMDGQAQKRQSWSSHAVRNMPVLRACFSSNCAIGALD